MRMKRFFSVLVLCLLWSFSVLPVHGEETADMILDSILSRMAESDPDDDWTVLCLARSGYLPPDDPYFEAFYSRAEKMAYTAGENGAISESKSTENSRLILALTSTGKDARNVNGVDLTAPYADLDWVERQGINGTVFALLALDSSNYGDASIRQQCADSLLARQLEDGGWAIMGERADPDMTAMALQALAPYRNEENVQKAVEEGLQALSRMQNPDGSFSAWGSTSSPSLSQAVVACTALGVDPDKDPAFTKNGKSVLAALLEFYDADSAMFCNTVGDGGNAMATRQGAYALIAVQRFQKGENSLYNMSDARLEKPDSRHILPAGERLWLLLCGCGVLLLLGGCWVLLFIRRKRIAGREDKNG